MASWGVIKKFLVVFRATNIAASWRWLYKRGRVFESFAIKAGKVGVVMSRVSKDRRILIYSHDTFGLGHLRRCRAIAHALVEEYKNLSVIILTGSPIIGSFDFRARVDFVRVPGVIKLRSGKYTPLNLHIDIAETLAMRASIIKHTAEILSLIHISEPTRPY